jgi:intracellular sulfur oxidation DsrE/DsrF family protein
VNTYVIDNVCILLADIFRLALVNLCFAGFKFIEVLRHARHAGAEIVAVMRDEGLDLLVCGLAVRTLAIKLICPRYKGGF